MPKSRPYKLPLEWPCASALEATGENSHNLVLSPPSLGMPYTGARPRIDIKLTKTFKLPIEGNRRSEAILDQLVIDEHRLVNSGLALLEALRPPTLSRNCAVRLFGKTTSEHFALRGTHYTKQILAEGIATKVYEQFHAQSKAFRRKIFRAVRFADQIDLMLLRQTVEGEGGSWKGFRLALRGGPLPFGVSAETAAEFARAEPLQLRPIRKPFAYFRTRAAKFVRTRRGNYGVKMVHPSEPGRHLFFRIRGRGYNAYIEQLLGRTGQDVGTFTAELRRERKSLVLSVLFSREVPPANYRGETYVGVDLGLVNIAVAAAVDPLGRRLIRPKFWNAGPLRHRLRILDARNARRKSNHKEPVSVTNYKRYWTYRIAHEIVEFAAGFPAPVVVLEDLRDIRAKHPSWGSDGNRSFYSWDYGRMRDFISHVAAWHNIRTVEVPARGTSSTCPKCGGIVRRRRATHSSKCANPACGYSNNDDLIGAFNIAFCGAEKESSKPEGASTFVRRRSATRIPEPLSQSTLVHPNVESLSSIGSEGVDAELSENPRQ